MYSADERGGDLGMMIMMLCGFTAIATHSIGANDMVLVGWLSRCNILIPLSAVDAAYFLSPARCHLPFHNGSWRAVNGNVVPGMVNSGSRRSGGYLSLSGGDV